MFGRRGEGREPRGGDSATTMDEANSLSHDSTGSADAAAAADAADAESIAEPEVEALHSMPFDRVATKKRYDAKLRGAKEARVKRSLTSSRQFSRVPFKLEIVTCSLIFVYFYQFVLFVSV